MLSFATVSRAHLSSLQPNLTLTQESVSLQNVIQHFLYLLVFL